MGGKSKVADLVWSRLGNPDNFIEPFAGSLAVLLRRPADHFANGYRVETVGDKDHHLCNVWRAIRNAPEKVAEFADNPVCEADLHSRHRFLVRSEAAKTFRERIIADPDYFDAKFAGWWVWGACAWIGSGWCNDGVDWKQMPEIGQRRDVGKGVCGAGGGRPQLTDAFDIGRGVNGNGSAKRPMLRRSTGLGVLAESDGGVFGQGATSSVDDFGGGVCDARREWLVGWMRRLSDRLRLVRTCYGHWSRICDSDSTLTRLGTCGVFLDPPYPTHQTKAGKRSKSRSDGLYGNDKGQDLDALRDEVLAWCRKWSGPQVRIAVCGYAGDGYEALVEDGWEEVPWTANGGYGNQGGGKKADNAFRERIWFNPSCVKPDSERSLFDGMEDSE